MSDRIEELARKLAHSKKDEVPGALVALGAALAARGDDERARVHLREAASLVAKGDEALARRVEALLAAAVQAASRAAPPASARDRTETLVRVLGSLTSCAAGTQEPLLEILKAVVAETGAARGFLMLHEGPVLRFELGLTRTGRRLAAEDFACSTTIVERALETGRPVLVPDLAAELPFALASSARSLGLRSALCAPLRVEKRRAGAPGTTPWLQHVKGVAGVLYVDSTDTASFGGDDARFFEALASASVLALRASGGRPASAPPPAEPETAERSFQGIRSRSPGMARALHLLERVAATDASVVIQGESGTGKELFARALHAGSRRAKGPFVAVECSSIPDDLVRHELFGHEDGAFTGAGPARAGLVERASGGTLFLDGVDEMPPSLQAALLRVLQEGEVRRLGGDRPRPVNVRLVAATQRDLAALVEEGRFRHDLLFRVAVVEIRLPPLRERLEDLEELARSHALGPGALERLAEHAWPGNVRELENVLRAASLASGGETIPVAALDALLGARRRAPAPASPASGGSLDGTIEEIERRAIVARLEALGWNQVRAAESLGFDRTTLRRKIARYGIARPERG